MLAFLVVLVLGFAIGKLRGGSVDALSKATLRFPFLVFVAVAFQVVATIADPTPAFAAIVSSYVVLFGFAWVNRTRAGMLAIGIGAQLNFIVIALNGGMPISAAAAARAGFVGDSAQRLVIRGKHFIAAAGEAKLGFLGDSIPLWRQPSVASIGDLIIWAGMIWLIQALMQAQVEVTTTSEQPVEPAE